MAQINLTIDGVTILSGSYQASGSVPTPPPSPGPTPVPTPEPVPGGVKIVDIEWKPGSTLPVSATPQDVIAVRFTTGSKESPGDNLPHIGVTDYPNPRQRRGAISLVAGDFNDLSPNGAPLSGSSVTSYFNVGNKKQGYYASLELNTTYYFNFECLDKSAIGDATAMVSLSVPGAMV